MDVSVPQGQPFGKGEGSNARPEPKARTVQAHDLVGERQSLCNFSPRSPATTVSPRPGALFHPVWPPDEHWVDAMMSRSHDGARALRTRQDRSPRRLRGRLVARHSLPLL